MTKKFQGVWGGRFALICAWLVAGVFALGGCAVFDGMEGKGGGSGGGSDATLPDATDTVSPRDTHSPGEDATPELPEGVTLEFVGQPGLAQVGRAITPPVRVALIHDGERLRDASVTVTLALSGGAPGAALSGASATAVNGLATFDQLAVDTPGENYVLTAGVSGVPQAQSAAFDVLDGAPSRLAFRTQPGNTIAGEALRAVGSTADSPVLIAVEFRDGDGGLLSDVTERVTLSLSEDGELKGEVEVEAVDGVAVFQDVSVWRAGSGLRLRATAGAQYQSSESDAFDVLPGLPSDTTTLQADPPNARADGEELIVLKLQLLDTFENPLPQVDVEFGSNNPNDEFVNAQGTHERTVQADENGEYTMGLRSREAGPRVVFAESRGVRFELEVEFVAGDLDALAIEGDVEDIVAGGTIAFSVLLQDADRNTMDSDAQVSLQLVGGSAGASLEGTTIRRAVNGRATFDDVTVTTAGSGYKIRAKVGGLSAETGTFDVLPGAPSQWEPSVTPAQVAVDISGGVLISSGVIADDFGNPVPGVGLSVSVTGSTHSFIPVDGSGSASGNTFSGTTNDSGKWSVRLRSDVAEQKDITLKVGDGSVLSESLRVEFVPGALSRIDVLSQPVSSAQAGSSIGSVVFQLKDSKSNALRAGTTVQLALTGGANAGKLTLQGGAAARAHNLQSDNDGKVKVTGAWVDKVGEYNLKASVGSISIDSDGFVITPGAFNQTQSSMSVNRTSGIIADDVDKATVTLTVRDAYGNPVPDVALSLVKVSETPASSGGAMDVSLTLERTKTDSSGQATGWVKAKSRAGSVVIKANVTYGGVHALGPNVTVDFVEPMFTISGELDYLPADYEVRVKNDSTPSAALTPTGPVVLFTLPRHTSYNLRINNSSAHLCVTIGPAQGKLTAPIELQVKCADKWIKVSSSKSSNFTVAVRKDQTLWAWGVNNEGQLGDGTTTSRVKPVRVGTKADWTDVSAGHEHVLALDSSKRLWGWGNNQNKRVSNEFSADRLTSPQQIPVPAIFTGYKWAEMAAGGTFSLAVLSNLAGQKAVIWGKNLAGELPGVMNSALVALRGCSIPTSLKGCVDANKVDGVAAGQSHFMVVGGTPAYDGTSTVPARPAMRGIAWRFFVNTEGQLGLGDTTARPNKSGTNPPTYDYELDWLRLDAGLTSSVGITRTDRHLYVWGQRFGTNPVKQAETPFGQERTSRWRQASAGKRHFLAIRENDQLYGWGEDASGALGDPSTRYVQDATLQTTTTVSGASAGADVSFYIEQAGGRLFGRGSNTSGNLGINKTSGQLSRSTGFLEVKTNP